ncbi:MULTISPECIES: alpha/beta fold hydrolase [unclassified Saccharopolyspora]|uniref:alpha/beta fold hydrolase n=1 Tax=unclassified Saccharopolyspora TaxID=2646250 RepID=UPI001CD4CAFD|nr:MULTISPECIES: alpha/beta fold hydrolase [unclassified Saccharopolyspora]MCA1186128.1 alpha/beta hydrolase [Saccharopolyspora sp. 6T]MCA1193111.1 alpha/beta hydrolase [Saccharopolyspora sp. 6V]
MPRTSHRIGALLLLTALVAGCSAGPSQRPAVAYRDAEQPVAPAPAPPGPAPLPGLGPSAGSALNWADCTGETREELALPATGPSFSCSQLLTTLDSPEAPAEGTTRAALLSTGTGGVPLVVLGDVHGEPGTSVAARLALKLPPEVLRTFRIIGMDRRGTGQSDPADCMPPTQRENIIGFDPQATDRASLDRLLTSVRVSSQECLLDLDDRLQAYDSWRTAADLEELRLELDVPKLHAVGIGEASRVLTTYAQRYPDSVGRMVFDGGLDPQLDAMAVAGAQAQGAEQTFDAFAADCAARGSCPLGPDPRRTVQELVQRTRARSLPAADGPVSAGKIVRVLLHGLGEPERWPRLASALAAANSGDGARISALAAPLVRETGADPARLDGDLITSCNDTRLRLPAERLVHVATEWTGTNTLFGGLFAQRLAWCAQWPEPQEEPPPPSAPGLPPIPVVTTENDPLVPAQGSKHLAEQLPTGVAVNWQGTGHGAIGRSDCVTDAVSRFLVQGALPAEGKACPA